MPLCAQRIDCDVWNWLLAGFTLGLVEPNVTPLAVRVTLVDDKRVGLADVVVCAALGAGRGRFGRVEEWVAAFGAEEV